MTSALLDYEETETTLDARTLLASIEWARSRGMDASVVFADATWEEYLALDEELEGRGVSLRFLEGELEIMSVSETHETLKAGLGCILEAYCVDQQIRFLAVGQTTLKIMREAGGEADESYYFHERKEWPDLAIEVALSSGGLNKLRFYAKFPVPEVWLWRRRSELEVHVLDPATGQYERREKSSFLPDLDLALLAECAKLEYTSDAIHRFRERSAR